MEQAIDGENGLEEFDYENLFSIECGETGTRGNCSFKVGGPDPEWVFKMFCGHLLKNHPDSFSQEYYKFIRNVAMEKTGV